MVEGPKVVLKVQRVQCLKGQCLEAMIVAPTQSTSQPLTAAMSRCIGRVVQSVWCLGKEMFLTMAQRHENIDQSEAENEVIGIRLHFGMAGSERLVYTRTLPPGHHVQNLYLVARQMMPKQSRKKWDICLIFNEQSLFVYDSTLCTKTSHYLGNAYGSLIRDVMSYDKFSIENVIQQIRESDQSRHIHEVIMVKILEEISCVTKTLQLRSKFTNISNSSSYVLICSGPVHSTWSRECDKDRRPL